MNPISSPSIAEQGPEERYAEQSMRGTAGGFRVATALGAFLFPAGFILDVFTQSQAVKPLLFIRLAATAAFVGLYLVSRRHSLRVNPYTAGKVTVLVAVIAITGMCLVLDGYRSPYYAGINLVILAAGVLFPWGAKHAGQAVALGLGVYFSAVLVGVHFQLQRVDLFVNNAYFLVTTALIVVVSARQSERERRESFDRLLAAERAVRAKDLRDEFISIVAHELRTPLTSLVLQVQTHQRRMRKEGGGYDKEAIERLVTGVLKQLDRLTRLVDEMLDLSRISWGKLRLEPERMSLNALVEDVVDRFLDQLQAAGCSCRLVPGPTVIGTWDRFRLEQVLANLLSNAIKYSAGRPIEISVAAEKDRAFLKIHDEGSGIAQEDLERIFGRYERTGAATHVSGLGLGLYICRQIVEAHGGRIYAESELGKGSTFTVELPHDAA